MARLLASVGVRAVKFVDRPAWDNSMKQRIDFRIVRDIFRSLAAPPRDLNRLRLAITQNF